MAATKETATVVEVTAAAYGDASLYNRKPARRATISAPSSSLPVAAGGRGRGRHLESTPFNRGLRTWGAAVDAAAFERDAVIGERLPGENEAGAEGDGPSRDRNDAADDAILLLSQTQSTNQRPLSRATDGNLSPLTAPGAAVAMAVAGGADRAAFASGLGVGFAEEEAAEAAAARHIARAPLAEVSAFFPDWEENVRFVFRQDEAELRDALRSINAALSAEEEGAVAGERAGAGVGVGAAVSVGAGPPPPEGGVHDENVPLVGNRSRRRSGSSSSKAKALIFFEGVVVEALKRTESDGSPATRPVIDRDDRNDDNDSDDDDAADEAKGGGDSGGDGSDGAAAVVCEEAGRSDYPGGVDGGSFCLRDAADRTTRSRTTRDEGSGGSEGRDGDESGGESDGKGDGGDGGGDGNGGGGGDGGGSDVTGCFRGDGCVDDAPVDDTQVDDGAPVDAASVAGAVAADGVAAAEAQDAAADVSGDK